MPRQKVIEVTATVTIATDHFAFLVPVAGLVVVEKAGTLLARDGDTEITTPYDDCVLIMPTRRPKKGETAVRLGRFVDDSPRSLRSLPQAHRGAALTAASASRTRSASMAPAHLP